MGQSLSRLADWQTDMLADALLATRVRGGGPVSPDDAVAAARALLPLLREVQDYVWRRHLAANADRLVDRRPAQRRPPGARGRVRRPGRATPRAAAAWAAASSARWSRTSRASPPTVDRPAPRPGGQDRRRRRAVHRTSAVRRRRDRPAAAREPGPPPSGPPLRVGAAYGTVLTRLGDVYSPVVNLASRLTSLARPGHLAGRPGAGPPAARTCGPTGSARCAGCRCAATTTSSPGWCAAGRAERRPGRRERLRRGRLRRGGPGPTTSAVGGWPGECHPRRPRPGRRARRPGPVRRPRPRRRPRGRRRPGRRQRRRASRRCCALLAGLAAGRGRARSRCQPADGHRRATCRRSPSGGPARPCSAFLGPPHRGHRARRPRWTPRPTALTDGRRRAPTTPTPTALERWLDLGGADLDERAERGRRRPRPRRSTLDAPMTALSGGQAARAGLASLLLSPLRRLPARRADQRPRPRRARPARALRRRAARRASSWSATTASSSPAPSPGWSSSTSPSSRSRVYGGGYEAYLAEREVARRHAREAYEEYADTQGRAGGAGPDAARTGWTRASATPDQEGHRTTTSSSRLPSGRRRRSRRPRPGRPSG